MEDLEGLALGTVRAMSGSSRSRPIPGAKLHAYPDGSGVFNDLGAGRIDVGFLDPLLIIAAQKQRPDMGIRRNTSRRRLRSEVKEHPAYQYFQPYMTSFYLPKEEPKLEQAMSEEIRKMYENGEMAAADQEVRRRRRAVPQAVARHGRAAAAVSIAQPTGAPPTI